MWLFLKNNRKSVDIFSSHVEIILKCDGDIQCISSLLNGEIKMSKYQAAQKQQRITQMVKLLESDPRYRHNIMAHRVVLMEQLRLQKDMFFSNHIGPTERAKNEYHIKNQFIKRILKLQKPLAQTVVWPQDLKGPVKLITILNRFLSCGRKVYEDNRMA